MVFNQHERNIYIDNNRASQLFNKKVPKLARRSLKSRLFKLLYIVISSLQSELFVFPAVALLLSRYLNCSRQLTTTFGKHNILTLEMLKCTETLNNQCRYDI